MDVAAASPAYWTVKAVASGAFAPAAVTGPTQAGVARLVSQTAVHVNLHIVLALMAELAVKMTFAVASPELATADVKAVLPQPVVVGATEAPAVAAPPVAVLPRVQLGSVSFTVPPDAIAVVSPNVKCIAVGELE